mmetsp:Transcript_27790/g.77647  ORF Transcript_27790/g.77647 Transcript_27790/m.77647 type:complete len:292 (-) Transcript_27790:83-958(-)
MCTPRTGTARCASAPPRGRRACAWQLPGRCTPCVHSFRAEVCVRPLVRGHALRRHRECDGVVEVERRRLERNLVRRVVRYDLRVRVLLGRHLLEDGLDLLVLGVGDRAATKLRREAVGGSHDGGVKVGPACHEDGVDFLADVLAQALDGLPIEYIKSKHLGVHVRESGAFLTVCEPENYETRRHSTEISHRLVGLLGQLPLGRLVRSPPELVEDQPVASLADDLGLAGRHRTRLDQAVQMRANRIWTSCVAVPAEPARLRLPHLGPAVGLLDRRPLETRARKIFDWLAAPW